MKSIWVILLWYLTIYLRSAVCIEPITTFGVIGAGSALAAAGFNFDTIKLNTYCRWYECCTPDYIPGNIAKLKEDLEESMFGQHIAFNIVTTALQYHFSNLAKSKKPLVMSFQGTPGIGKTFITNVMKEAIYKKGKESKYVHFYDKSSFPLNEKADKYKKEITETVKNSLSACPLSLFIFDEVDKMPNGIMEGITPMLDHSNSDPKIDSNKAVYIFISNSGGLAISQHLAGLMNRGLSREDTELRHFEKLTEVSLYNSEGALQKSGTIQNAVIDHFIPFLPLEQRHVKKCIENEFARVGIPKPTKEQVNEVLKDVTYEKEQSFFAVYGCKRLEKKVGLVAQLATINHT